MHAMKVIASDKAPAAIGPYSQALACGSLLFVSGQIPLDPATGTMPEGIREQTETALTNVATILAAGGSSLDRVVKATVYLVDMGDFPAVNEVYAAFFGTPFPARSCVAVRALPRNAKIEIEVIAALYVQCAYRGRLPLPCGNERSE